MNQTGGSNSATPEALIDDIRVKYHPHSGRISETLPFEEFGRKRDSASTQCTPNETPWKPFRSQADFEFAEIALDAALNQQQVEALIKLFHHCIESKDKLFTLRNHADLVNMWDNASSHLTPVCDLAKCWSKLDIFIVYARNSDIALQGQRSLIWCLDPASVELGSGLGWGPITKQALWMGCSPVFQIWWYFICTFHRWAMDCWSLLGNPSAFTCSSIYIWTESKTWSFVVSAPKRWKASVFCVVCGQDKVIIIRNRKGVPRYGTMCQFACGVSKRRWTRWRACRWLAANCTFLWSQFLLKSFWVGLLN